MPPNGERFIAAYNRIDKTLKKRYGIDYFISFTRMLDRLKHKDVIVRKYELDLKQYAELRNAIVHERVEPEYWIADPHDDVVERIERISSQLLNPQLVYPKYKRHVSTFQTTDTLNAVLKVIKKHRYTQFPVYEKEQFVGLLTGNGIVRWISEQAGGNMLAIETVQLSTLLEYEKHQRNFIFMKRTTNVFEAKENFVKRFEQELRKLEAILITETGRSDEKLLGIITPIDLIDIE